MSINYVNPMSLRKNLHAADGSQLGFLFQIEKVILWLSSLDIDAVVGIEVDDDIVVKLAKGEKINEIYEQAKHTLKNHAPFSDKSEDLWKTLAIWINAVMNGKINPEKVRFSPFSNKIIPKTRLLYALHEADYTKVDKLTETCSLLKRTAKTLRKGLKQYGETVLDCPDAILEKIINSIQIIEPTYQHNQANYKKQLSQNLSMAEELPFDDMLNKMFGFIAMQLIDNWRNREESWISVKAFNSYYIQLIGEYVKKPFIEKTSDSLPVSKKEIEQNQTKVYVEQLRLIDCSEEELLEAIHDYYRASTERNRFAKDYEISREKIEQYYNDLHEKWKAISRPRFRSATSKKESLIGYSVFYETIQYKGKLSNYEPEQPYTYKGAYHHLANELELGWHPKWEKTFKPKRK